MATARGELVVDRREGTVLLGLAGSWRLGSEHPAPQEALARVGSARRVAFEASGLAEWDSALLAFLVDVLRQADERGIEVDRGGLPDGVRRLLELAFAVPEQEGARRRPSDARLLARVGAAASAGLAEARAMLDFVGQVTIAFGRLVRGRARFRRSDLALALQECGPEALGIVGLISFLIGLILAFMGAAQLRVFGAEVYVADLVALGMAREMAPLMTGVIMAGRTGAAYAAQLGTMTVNEEIDAFRTLGFPPMEFLVLPRMLALVLMMPLLTLYSNVLGNLGGFVVGTGLLDVTPTTYFDRSIEAVDLADFGVGLVKASVIGVLVAVAGCMRGMQSGRSASAVGLATTSAVVTAIVMIIVSEAVFAVVFDALGI